MTLQAFNGLVLRITQHGVVNFRHIVGNRPDDGGVHLEEVLRVEAVLLEVTEYPVPLSKAAIQDLDMGRHVWPLGEMPAKDFESPSGVDRNSVLILNIGGCFNVEGI